MPTTIGRASGLQSSRPLQGRTILRQCGGVADADLVRSERPADVVGPICQVADPCARACRRDASRLLPRRAPVRRAFVAILLDAFHGLDADLDRAVDCSDIRYGRRRGDPERRGSSRCSDPLTVAGGRDRRHFAAVLLALLQPFNARPRFRRHALGRLDRLAVAGASGAVVGDGLSSLGGRGPVHVDEPVSWCQLDVRDDAGGRGWSWRCRRIGRSHAERARRGLERLRDGVAGRVRRVEHHLGPFEGGPAHARGHVSNDPQVLEAGGQLVPIPRVQAHADGQQRDWRAIVEQPPVRAADVAVRYALDVMTAVGEQDHRWSLGIGGEMRGTLFHGLDVVRVDADGVLELGIQALAIGGADGPQAVSERRDCLGVVQQLQVGAALDILRLRRELDERDGGIAGHEICGKGVDPVGHPFEGTREARPVAGVVEDGRREVEAQDDVGAVGLRLGGRSHWHGAGPQKQACDGDGDGDEARCPMRPCHVDHVQERQPFAGARNRDGSQVGPPAHASRVLRCWIVVSSGRPTTQPVALRWVNELDAQ